MSLRFLMLFAAVLAAPRADSGTKAKPARQGAKQDECDLAGTHASQPLPWPVEKPTLADLAPRTVSAHLL
jgi:hypothetical protein